MTLAIAKRCISKKDCLSQENILPVGSPLRQICHICPWTIAQKLLSKFLLLNKPRNLPKELLPKRNLPKLLLCNAYRAQVQNSILQVLFKYKTTILISWVQQFAWNFQFDLKNHWLSKVSWISKIRIMPVVWLYSMAHVWHLLHKVIRLAVREPNMWAWAKSVWEQYQMVDYNILQHQNRACRAESS